MITRATHPTDRRRQIITITETGRTLIRDNLHAARRLNAWLRQSFGAEKLDHLLDLLNELDQIKR